MSTGKPQGWVNLGWDSRAGKESRNPECQSFFHQWRKLSPGQGTWLPQVMVLPPPHASSQFNLIKCSKCRMRFPSLQNWVIRHFSEGIWEHWVALGNRHVQIWAVQGHSGYSEANEYHSAIRKNKILPFAVHGWTWRALSWVKLVRQRKTNTVWYHL